MFMSDWISLSARIRAPAKLRGLYSPIPEPEHIHIIGRAYLDIYPVLLSQRLVFVHQNTLRHGGDQEWKRLARIDRGNGGVLSRRVLQSR